MRGLHLNGWQRIGIVASVIWPLVGAYWGLRWRYDPIYRGYDSCTKLVLDNLMDYDACQKTLDLQLADADSQRLLIAVIFGLAPIPIAWLITYALVGLVRWIRRGFKPA